MVGPLSFSPGPWGASRPGCSTWNLLSPLDIPSAAGYNGRMKRALLSRAEVAGWLAAEIKRRGWTFSDAAGAWGVNKGELSNVLRGKRGPGSKLRAVCQLSKETAYRPL